MHGDRVEAAGVHCMSALTVTEVGRTLELHRLLALGLSVFPSAMGKIIPLS